MLDFEVKIASFFYAFIKTVKYSMTEETSKLPSSDFAEDNGYFLRPVMRARIKEDP